MAELSHIVPLYMGFCGWQIQRWHPFWRSRCRSGYKGHGQGQPKTKVMPCRHRMSIMSFNAQSVI